MKKFSALLITLIVATALKAQTATPMAQYAGNQLIYNPGFAGAHDLFSANISYRTLWVGIPNSPTLISFNMHAPFVGLRNSLGFIYQRETVGPQFINIVNMTYAHKIPLGESSFLSLGVQGGLLNAVTDWDMVDEIRHEWDIALGQGRMVTNRFDMNLGAYFQAPNFYLGLAVRHLTAPSFDEVRSFETNEVFASQIRRQFFFMGGYNFMLNLDWDLRPRVLMRYKHGMPLTVSAGLDVVYANRFTFGTNFMTGQNAVSLMAAAEVIEGLRIGYAFCINFGSLQSFQRGSHEIFISFFLPVWNRVNDPQIRQHFR